jgi:hypothetical protein
MWALGCTVFECCVGRPWQIDWPSLGTDEQASAYIEAQIATVPTTDPWILAVLRNTLKMWVLCTFRFSIVVQWQSLAV